MRSCLPGLPSTRATTSFTARSKALSRRWNSLGRSQPRSRPAKPTRAAGFLPTARTCWSDIRWVISTTRSRRRASFPHAVRRGSLAEHRARRQTAALAHAAEKPGTRPGHGPNAPVQRVVTATVEYRSRPPGLVESGRSWSHASHSSTGTRTACRAIQPYPVVRARARTT